MNYTQSTLSRKHQTVIPAPIRLALKLKPGDRVLWKVINVDGQKKAIAQPAPQDWAKHTRGLAQQLWKDIDINQYVKGLRDEWDGK